MAFHPVLGIPRLKTVPGGHMSGDYSHWFSTFEGSVDVLGHC